MITRLYKLITGEHILAHFRTVEIYDEKSSRRAHMVRDTITVVSKWGHDQVQHPWLIGIINPMQEVALPDHTIIFYAENDIDGVLLEEYHRFVLDIDRG